MKFWFFNNYLIIFLYKIEELFFIFIYIIKKQKQKNKKSQQLSFKWASIAVTSDLRSKTNVQLSIFSPHSKFGPR